MNPNSQNEKPVKFIVIYEESGDDPHKTFTSRKELMEWIKEAKEDEDIDFDTIQVYPAGKELRVEFKTTFSLKEV